MCFYCALGTNAMHTHVTGKSVTWMQKLMETPVLKIYIFFDIKHLYSAWVADAASFPGG
jgi:hypothetical protein